jgi:hypothetical protein
LARGEFCEFLARDRRNSGMANDLVTVALDKLEKVLEIFIHKTVQRPSFI